MTKVSNKNENTKSKNPKNIDVKNEIRITSAVNIIVCFLVGQLTCFNSTLVSFI